MTTRFLMYLLIASEFIATACWFLFQWRKKHRRDTDILIFSVYSLLSISYLFYGIESFNYVIASPIGYGVDGIIALVLAAVIFKKIYNMVKMYFVTRNIIKK